MANLTRNCAIVTVVCFFLGALITLPSDDDEYYDDDYNNDDHNGDDNNDDGSFIILMPVFFIVSYVIGICCNAVRWSNTTAEEQRINKQAQLFADHRYFYSFDSDTNGCTFSVESPEEQCTVTIQFNLTTTEQASIEIHLDVEAATLTEPEINSLKDLDTWSIVDGKLVETSTITEGEDNTTIPLSDLIGPLREHIKGKERSSLPTDSIEMQRQVAEQNLADRFKRLHQDNISWDPETFTVVMHDAIDIVDYTIKLDQDWNIVKVEYTTYDEEEKKVKEVEPNTFTTINGHIFTIHKWNKWVKTQKQLSVYPPIDPNTNVPISFKENPVGLQELMHIIGRKLQDNPAFLTNDNSASQPPVQDTPVQQRTWATWLRSWLPWAQNPAGDLSLHQPLNDPENEENNRFDIT